MPYIKQSERAQLDYMDASTPGQLNYLMTLLVHEYVNRQGRSYQAYNDAVGALECCKLELYRRLIAPYEDEKIKENGDV